MATYSTTIKQFIVTASANADFRAIVQLWHDFFATTCGFTQASDTGQIVPSTVNYPGSNNTTAGEEIWYFADSLQSTRPVGFRVQYGRGADANDWRILFSVSMSLTNGSRVFVGQESASKPMSYATAGTRTNADTTAYRVIGSGGTNRFVIAFFPDVASTPWGSMLSLERVHDSSGDDVGDGLTSTFWRFRDSQSGVEQGIAHQWQPGYQPTWVNFGSSSQGHGLWSLMSAGQGHFGNTPRKVSDADSTQAEGKIYLFPTFPTRAGWKYPNRNYLLYAMADLPSDFSNVAIPFYGSDRTYKPLGTFTGLANGALTQCCAAICFE